MTTWRILLAKAGCTDENRIACTLDDAGLDKEFYAGYGTSCGEPFTAWTADRVFYPVVYDGAEWVESVPRNPCNEASRHSGGE